MFRYVFEKNAMYNQIKQGFIRVCYYLYKY